MTEKGVPKPSQPENEYFVREDAETKRRIALAEKRAIAAEEARRLKELHFMHCPKCGLPMDEVRRGAYAVEACYACGGVFMDKPVIDVIAAPKQKGMMAAVLKWLEDESHRAPSVGAEEAARLKELHLMHCPKCGMKMHEVRQGPLTVDTCFSCGGVFLDKSEIGVIAAPKQKGIMGAILNWFKDETHTPVK